MPPSTCDGNRPGALPDRMKINQKSCRVCMFYVLTAFHATASNRTLTSSWGAVKFPRMVGISVVEGNQFEKGLEIVR